jgi:small-conductance mechanosensitive channel
MLQRLIVFLIFSAITASIWIANLHYRDIELDKFFYTALTITVSFFIFRIILEGIVGKRIREARMRYSFRKTMHILFLVLSCVFILRVWIINPQALLVAYGLIAAGVAISLQDLFKNFAGGVVILVTGLYHVGNRIEINGKFGDVIDVSIFYTTVLEIREWVDGDQATGRLSTIPNGVVLSGIVNNYTKDHHFLWDEISLPVTYASNWKEASEIMQKIAVKETERFVSEAKQSLSHLEERYYMSERSLEPSVFLQATDNWIKLTLRYVVEVRERRLMHNRLTEILLQEFESNPSINIASSSLAITTLPDIKVKRIIKLD